MAKTRGLGEPISTKLTPEQQHEREKEARALVRAQTQEVATLLKALNGALLKLNNARAICGLEPVNIADITDTFPSQELADYYHDFAGSNCEDVRLQPPLKEDE